MREIGSDDAASLLGQNRVLERIAAGAPLEDALAELTALVETQQPGVRCGILVVSRDGGRFERSIGPSLPDAYHAGLLRLPVSPPYQGSCGEAAYTGVPVAAPDVASDTRYPDAWRALMAGSGVSAMRSIPVRGEDGRVQASIALCFNEARDPRPDGQELTGAAVRLAALALGRHREQDAIRRSEALFRAMAEALPAPVYTTDAGGRIQFYNAAAAELWGWRPELGQQLWSGAWRLFRPDGSPLPPNEVPLAMALKERRPVHGREVVSERPDGSRAIVEAYPTPLFDASGSLAGAVNMLLDITERRRAEEGLRRSEEEFRALAENLPNLCWMADASGYIYWYNRRWYDYTGSTPAEMEGWGWQSVHDPAALPDVMARWTDALAAEAPFEMTFPLKAADGSFRPFLTRIVPVRGEDGAVARWFGNNVDVSAQQQTAAALRDSQDALKLLNEELEARVAEEVASRQEMQHRLAQAQRMEALGQLAGGIAHDFNNVLQAVASGLSLIQRRAGDPDAVRQLARMAADAAARGSGITARLLAFARDDDLLAAAIPIRPLLENLREILAPTLGAGIAVRIEADAAAPPLLADKVQLETVMINLAVNARDAMPGGGALTIAARADAVGGGEGHPAQLPAGRYLRLDLTDTGAGMDAATLARASEPFFTTKPAGKGTGLGLAMARGFAQQSGGGLALASVPGRGTTVSLWFPEASEPGSLDQEAGASVVPPRGPGLRVLVVDDDLMVREVLARQLEEEFAHVVTQASDGLAALERLDSGAEVDLLVTDLAMPGMDGLALTRAARRRRPGLPIVLLTGYADASARLDLEGMADEATILLRKPVSGDDLSRCVASLMRAGEAA